MDEWTEQVWLSVSLGTAVIVVVLLFIMNTVGIVAMHSYDTEQATKSQLQILREELPYTEQDMQGQDVIATIMKYQGVTPVVVRINTSICYVWSDTTYHNVYYSKGDNLYLINVVRTQATAYTLEALLQVIDLNKTYRAYCIKTKQDDWVGIYFE